MTEDMDVVDDLLPTDTPCESDPQKYAENSANSVYHEHYDDHLFTIGHSKATTRVKIANVAIDMLVDTGASVNVIDETTFNWMRGRMSPALHLAPSHVRLYPYGAKAPLPVMGEFKAETTSCSTSTSTTARFIVVRGNSGCLLGRETAPELKLIHMAEDQNQSQSASAVHIDTRSPDRVVDGLKSKYPEVFSGFGKLTDYQVHVHINSDVSPVAQPARRIPFHLRDKVDEKLQELIEMDIIEPASGPTSWASPLVVVPKPNGDVRICIDMRRANQAVIRERHPIPTLDETLTALNGAAIFSKLDLKMGYHQIELDDESRDITTFVTHRGVMRYKRLIFGLSSASEAYQYAIQTALQGLEGVKNISDDIVALRKGCRGTRHPPSCRHGASS